LSDDFQTPIRHFGVVERAYRPPRTPAYFEPWRSYRRRTFGPEQYQIAKRPQADEIA
jgi:hypothetical protein